MRVQTASGDPAMAFMSSIGWRRTDTPSGVLGGLSSCSGRHATASVTLAHSARGKSARENNSAADAEFLDDALVARLVGALEVIEQLTPLRDHLEQASS